MAVSQQQIDRALRHLRTSDPVMRDLIRRAGPFKLRLERDRFRMLVRSIISQQISTSAARSILARFEALVHPEQPSADNVARLTVADLRSAGVSPQKTGYLLDLAQKVGEEQVRLRHIGRLSDEAVIEELTRVKGIGRWTAQMFLIFALGRLDVFPHDDLGVRSAIRNLYQLQDLPDKATSHRIAEPWRPYASVASWYCWRSFELKPT
jgi:DNA-3-methyladenine glycosylase II